MIVPAHPRVSELLIVSVTPQNLERGILWFSQNLAQIKKARASNPWWQNNTLVLEKDLIIKPAELGRKLLDLGYERSQTVLGKGLFAARGGVVEIWPVNEEKPCLVEFRGNQIVGLNERSEIEEKIKPRAPARSVEKMQAGSFVVHVDHGIGIFRGIASENSSEFFGVEYASPAAGKKPDMLYVPTSQKDRLTPYIGFETPRIHRLGGSLWQKTTRCAKENAEKLARELLAIYSRREISSRPPYPENPPLENEIRLNFPYEETLDQKRAEKEILKDLEKEKPMDRILCGEVGFGKTELALRAALRVISSGKQVALLAPTTVLSSQHEKNFRERLTNLPVEIRALSRLSTPARVKETLQEIEQGTADCVIGTHRLLSSDVKFKNLGLVIIDEEQRFGVRHKEHFKNLRAEIDILSLSATPIPRTLSLALAKLRDLSLITTPPQGRLPIKTAVLPYGPKLIKETVEFELNRGGQIYFLHNTIETLGNVKEKLLELPLKSKLKIGVIHGRLPEKNIIKEMDEFRAQKTNLLLATTIIENGLDISSANTLIVEDATRLGLAQAHQLRGRIGRGDIQAFAYFLYPVRSLTKKNVRRQKLNCNSQKSQNYTRRKNFTAKIFSSKTSNGVYKPRYLTEKARERLEALKEYSELGAGYEIARRDLEIRGAGNILGREQSGAVNKVGLNLYCQILAEAVESLRQHKLKISEVEPH